MLRLVVSSVGVCLFSLFFANVTEAQTFDPEMYYQIVARHSGKCLDVAGAATGNLVGLQQYTCNSVPQENQLWTIIPTGAGTFRIVSANSAKCVDIAGAATTNGALAQQYDCNLAYNQTNQVFAITSAPTAGYWWISAANTAFSQFPRCLDVNGAGNLAAVQQWSCAPTAANREWSFVPFTPRDPRSHIKMFSYYGAAPPSAVGVASPFKDHVNNVEFGYDPTVSGNGFAMIDEANAQGMKASIRLYNLFQVGPRNAPAGTPGCPALPDDKYARCSAEGGLKIDRATIWAQMVTALQPYYNAGKLASFNLMDEPYWNLNYYSTFTVAEVSSMLDEVATMVHTSFPNVPVYVVDYSVMMGLPYPASVDWVGFDCYNTNHMCLDTTGTLVPYTTILNNLKSVLTPNQQIILVPHASVEKYPNPIPSGCDVPPPTLPLSPYLTTTQAEQDSLVGEANYYINIAMAEPRVVALRPWVWASRNVEYPLPGETTDARCRIGLFIGTEAIAPVQTKWRFLARGLGFGQ